MSKHEPIGYVVVDSQTNAIDWDGDMHPTREAAIDSLTGPHHMWCKSVEAEDDDHTYWGKAYTIGVVYGQDVPLDITVASNEQLLALPKGTVVVSDSYMDAYSRFDWGAKGSLMNVATGHKTSAAEIGADFFPARVIHKYWWTK